MEPLWTERPVAGTAHGQPKPIGIVRDYTDLLVVARARMAQLNISFETLDAVSGVQPGYSAKLLGLNPARGLGPMSFCAIMGGLCMQLVAVPDPDAFARIKSQLDKKLRRGPRMNPAARPNVKSRSIRSRHREG
jgi:hypothetical protein